MLRGESHPEPPTNNLLFVYGTLKRGGYYHSVIAQHSGELVGEGRLVHCYPLVVADYPCLLDQCGQGQHVRGEVYRITCAEGWQTVDRLEDNPNEYERREEPGQWPTAERSTPGYISINSPTDCHRACRW